MEPLLKRSRPGPVVYSESPNVTVPASSIAEYPRAGTASNGEVISVSSPLRALRAKRLYFGDARIIHEFPVLGRFNSDQGDFAFGVVMKAPAVALCQRRHPKMRVALAQELLAVCGPDGFWDVMEDGVRLKGDIFFGVLVRMLEEQLVLNYCLRLLGTSCLWHLSFSSRTVVGDLNQCVVVVHTSFPQAARRPSFPWSS